MYDIVRANHHVLSSVYPELNVTIDLALGPNMHVAGYRPTIGHIRSLVLNNHLNGKVGAKSMMFHHKVSHLRQKCRIHALIRRAAANFLEV